MDIEKRLRIPPETDPESEGIMITKSILREKIDYLNTLTGLHFDLDFAYGGVRLVRIVNGSGGCADCSVRMTKQQLADTLDAIEYVVLRVKEGLK